jgi:hypothetical protein
MISTIIDRERYSIGAITLPVSILWSILPPMNFDTLLWFGISGGTLWFAGSLLWQRYVKRTDYAVQSRGSFLLFAIFALLFSVGSFFAGLFTIG